MKIKFNREGFEEVLRSPQVAAWVDREANAVAARAGSNFEASSMQGKSRYRAIVIPSNGQGYYENKRYNLLLKALGG